MLSEVVYSNNIELLIDHFFRLFIVLNVTTFDKIMIDVVASVTWNNVKHEHSLLQMHFEKNMTKMVLC